MSQFDNTHTESERLGIVPEKPDDLPVFTAKEFYRYFYITCAVVVILGALLGASCSNAGWERDAVKHGAAHYDKTTGAWMWNTP